MENIHDSIEQIKARMRGIEDRIDIFTTTITQTQARVSAMEKDVYKNNQMENKVKQLEKYNKELESKIEKSMSEKFEEIDGKINKLEVQKELVKGTTVNENPISSEKYNRTSQFDDLKCFICEKHFRNTTLLGIHDKRFHLEKGTAFYKCDNCSDRFEDKIK